MLNNFSADFMHNEKITKELDLFAEKVEEYFSSKTEEELSSDDVFNGLVTLVEETILKIREMDSSFECGCFIGSFVGSVIDSCAASAY